MARPLLYMLDGHALAYRNYFANSKRPLITSTGIPTSAIFGFVRTLMEVLSKDRPTYIAVAFDDGLSGRDTWFDAYKAHRDAAPADLDAQVLHIRELVDAFNVPVLIKPGYEADDLLGTAARIAEAEGADVMIYSGDRDLLQLLSEHTRVRLYIPMAGTPDETYDVAKFRERYGFEPIQLIDFKALKGDTSDNIPGVAGIGDKTATTLIQQFGSVEAIYDQLDSIAGKVREKLEAGREMALLSKRLATIQRDAPIEFALERCQAHVPDPPRIQALFERYEFSTLARQLASLPLRGEPGDAGNAAVAEAEDDPDVLLAAGPELVTTAPRRAVLQAPAADADSAWSSVDDEPPQFDVEIVRDAEGLAALVARLNAAERIAFDTETTSTDPMTAHLVGISFCVDGLTGYYLPLAHTLGDGTPADGGDGQMTLAMGGEKAPGQLPLDVVLDAIRPAMTDPNIGKVLHHANFDLMVLVRYGLDVTPVVLDTMVAEWVRDPQNGDLGLKRLAYRLLRLHMTEITELIGTGKGQKTFDTVLIERAAPYAAADAVATWLLADPVVKPLHTRDRDPKIDPLWGIEHMPTPYDVLMNIEMPLVPVLVDMQQNGVMLDVPYLRELGVKLGQQLAALEQEIYALSGGYGAFNINSPKQLNDVLFGKLGLKAEGLRKTSHGYSTAADVLDNMRGEHPIIELILNYRELSKLKGTYVDSLPNLINPRTGRVHTSFNQTGASTGRMSSSNPNLQNIPIRTKVGRDVRRAFIAPEGKLLLSVDYSQVELRIMAHITQEPTLLEAFRADQDIHATTASLVYNVPLAEVTKPMRNFAKRINFGILYGMGAFRLARDSDLTLAEADAFIKQYFAQLPRVREYLDRAKQLARSPGYLNTLFGRRRTFPALLTGGNRNLQQAAEREAINMPIQGTAADIIKMAMIALYEQLRGQRDSCLILQVHDELVLEVPEDDAERVAAMVVETMESAAELLAPLKANAQVGRNWNDLVAVGG
jgi:DNA polymerase-1